MYAFGRGKKVRIQRVISLLMKLDRRNSAGRATYSRITAYENSPAVNSAVNFNGFGSMMIYTPKRHRGIKIECCDDFAGVSVDVSELTKQIPLFEQSEERGPSTGLFLGYSTFFNKNWHQARNQIGPLDWPRKTLHFNVFMARVPTNWPGMQRPSIARIRRLWRHMAFQRQPGGFDMHSSSAESCLIGRVWPWDYFFWVEIISQKPCIWMVFLKHINLLSPFGWFFCLETLWWKCTHTRRQDRAKGRWGDCGDWKIHHL